MHERPFTEEIVSAIRNALKDHPGAVPQKVRVKVGEIYHLVPDSVRTHFTQITQNTPYSAIQLDLVEEPLRVECPSCGKNGGVEDHHMPTCTSCGSLAVKTVAGSTITVDEIVFTQTEHSH